jgi:ferredoxin
MKKYSCAHSSECTTCKPYLKQGEIARKRKEREK